VYVRFVVEEIDPDTGVEVGIVQAMYRLWRSEALSAHEEAWWQEIRTWLNVDLDAPDRLARSRRPGARECSEIVTASATADQRYPNVLAGATELARSVLRAPSVATLSATRLACVVDASTICDR
jgi:hypothetical protein